MVEPALDNSAQQIPDKLYFRIGEVSRLTGVKQYVLRYWESEFPALGPRKSGTGHRLYKRKDVELLLEIKHLLYEKRFTIEGARKWLEDRRKAPGGSKPAANQAEVQAELFASPIVEELERVRRELRDILKLLK
jgi:DNA-binding transcriptional MerR regulator